MKCNNYNEYSLLDGDLTDDQKDHLKVCDTCRIQFEQEQSLKRLLSLKRYESVDSQRQNRQVEAIRQRLETVENEPALSILENISQKLLYLPEETVKFGFAAVFIALLAVYIYISGQTPESEKLIVDVPEHVEEAPKVAVETFTNTNNLESIGRLPPAITAQPVSNRSPRDVQYGPGQSLPVNFEY